MYSVLYKSFLEEIEQCGNYVKCEARQMTEDEELLFESGNHPQNSIHGGKVPLYTANP